MRAYKIIPIVVFVAIVAGGAAVLRSCPRTVPFKKCSPLYQQYANQEGISAAFVKDYRINDTLTVDVTLLKATDSAGWATLQEVFAIPPLPPNLAEAAKTQHFTEVLYAPKDDYSRRATIQDTAIDLVAISRWAWRVCVFATKNMDEAKAVSNFQHDESIKQQTDTVGLRTGLGGPRRKPSSRTSAILVS